uniref:Methuselah-like 15, isoform D n=1 Tax=Drosophila melanogaster TaxID=7227 RepID=Q8IPD1_DROME|nr:methuselah-like 15, isoform D [Drosophila melanogaster]AAN10726.2 methuselah-like 15, isoform D [Drosophila melanogaster]|eukprot:NP_723537.2 methuselah-like 15, isoform D [Drosophila melanogaster]
MNIGLSLVCLILSGISKVLAVQLCCAANSLLFKYRRTVDNAEIYQCASAASNISELPDLAQVIGKLIPPMGLGLEKAINDSGHSQFALSKCQNFSSLSISDLGERTLNLRNNSCIGLLNRRLIVLSCEFEKNVPSQSVGFVNKCCPQGFIYVSENNTCKPGESDFFVYTSIISSPIIFFDNTLNCSDHRALVEYTLSSGKVHFHNNSLIWKDGTNSLPSSKFCIEAIHDSDDADLDRGALPEQKFLVRACQEMKICQKIPCIRRCCAEGEMYAKGNFSTYCKIDGTDFKFEGFQNLNINANFSKPSDFGIVHGLQCPKFRLDPDNFPDDSHTINPSNGSLIIHNTFKTYTNTQYCVERVRPNQKSSCIHFCALIIRW